MAGISPLYTTAVSAPGLDRSRVTQARREAEQAQATADGLRREADRADSEARNGQDKANTLSDRSRQLDATYDRELRGATQAVQPASTQFQPSTSQATNRLVNVTA